MITTKYVKARKLKEVFGYNYFIKCEVLAIIYNYRRGFIYDL